LGKTRPIKVLQKSPELVPTLAHLGDSWDILEELINSLEAFTCVIYGKPRFTGANDLRYYMVKEKCGEGEYLNAEINVDLAAIPPCRCNLKEHIKKCNYQVSIWKHGLEQHPEIPTPSAGLGWTSQTACW
jgi:hypothetical protein